MSNRAVVLQTWVANNPDAGLALVTKPVPEAEPGQVVVHIILRPVNPRIWCHSVPKDTHVRKMAL
jgi:hypothetical protein